MPVQPGVRSSITSISVIFIGLSLAAPFCGGSARQLKGAEYRTIVQNAGIQAVEVTAMATRVRARTAVDGEDEGASGSRSVRRALEIFELMLARGEALAVVEIVSALKIPKSTAYELARTLTEAGYLERMGKEGRLFLGRKLFELGMMYRSQIDLLKEGSQVVEALRDATGETVQFSVLENEMMLVLIKEE